MGIKELIDLRSIEEVEKDAPNCPVFAGVSYCLYTRSAATNMALPDPTHTTMVDGDIMRVQLPLLQKSRLYGALLSRMPLGIALRVIATRLYDPEASRRAAIQEVNRGGLPELYEIILDIARPELAAALRRATDALVSRRPLLFFCKAGKDRTGLLAALLLAVAGASDDAIVADYVRSDEHHMVALAGLEDEPQVSGLDRSKFERAPEDAIRHALAYMRKKGGGSVEGYLEACGFDAVSQARLRELLRGETARGVDGGEGARSRLNGKL